METPAQFLPCRNCGYDLRAATEACPECGLDVAVSQAHPSFARAGSEWTERVRLRVRFALWLVVLSVVGITLSIALESTLRGSFWMLAINYLPFISMAAIPVVMSIAPPARLGIDWRSLRRTCVVCAAMALAAGGLELAFYHFSIAGLPLGLFWILSGLCNAASVLMFAIMPLSLLPFHSLLSRTRTSRPIQLFVLCGALAFVFSLGQTTLLAMQNAAWMRLLMPLQLVMALLLLVSLLGSIWAIVSLKFQLDALSVWMRPAAQ